MFSYYTLAKDPHFISDYDTYCPGRLVLLDSELIEDINGLGLYWRFLGSSFHPGCVVVAWRQVVNNSWSPGVPVFPPFKCRTGELFSISATTNADRLLLCAERPNLVAWPGNVELCPRKGVDWYKNHPKYSRPAMILPAPSVYMPSSVIVPVDTSQNQSLYPENPVDIYP